MSGAALLGTSLLGSSLAHLTETPRKIEQIELTKLIERIVWFPVQADPLGTARTRKLSETLETSWRAPPLEQVATTDLAQQQIRHVG